MKPTRIFAFRWTPGEMPGSRIGARLAESFGQRGWSELIARRGALVLCKEHGRDDVLVLPNELGAIVGPVFRRADQRQLRTDNIDASLAQGWASSAGQSFADAHWGGYLAFFHDRARDILHIVREPMGAGPCHYARVDEGTYIFTHAADYVAVRPELAPDWDYLSAFLVSPRLVSSRTAIAGVSELLAGTRLSLSRTDEVVETFWRPLPSDPRLGPSDFAKAVRELRGVIVSCAGAWAGGDRCVLHRLSGGLDSSITLAALTMHGDCTKIVAVNEFPRDVPEGDERGVARLVAKKFGVQLIELEVGPEDVDYARLLDVEISAKPSLSELSFAGTAFAQFARQGGFALMTSGQGGDQVLHRSRTPEIAADAVRDNLALGELLTIALATARLGRRPVWDVFAAQLRHGLARQPLDQFAPLISSDDLIAGEAGEAAKTLWRAHPWADDVKRTSPARGKRMLRIADLQFYHAPSVLTELMTNALVLTAQPIVEFCLTIPPYVMTAGGRDRALARAAFAELLPEAVRNRSLKGDTTRYFTAVLERNFEFLRAVLIEGRLSQQGVVDGDGLKAALARSQLASGKLATSLMQCLAAELWVRRFEAACAAARASQAQPAALN